MTIAKMEGRRGDEEKGSSIENKSRKLYSLHKVGHGKVFSQSLIACRVLLVSIVRRIPIYFPLVWALPSIREYASVIVACYFGLFAISSTVAIRLNMSSPISTLSFSMSDIWE